MALTKVTAGLITANAVVDSFGTQSITGDKLGLTAINANNIVNASITGAKLASETITGDKIGVGQITSNLFAAGAVTATSIYDGTSNVSVTSTNGNVIVGTAGSERVRFSTGGDVGIGTSNPTARLDVRRSTTEGSIAEFHQSSGYGIDISSSEAIANISSGYLQSLAFRTDPSSGAVERMRIDSAGRVTMPYQPAFNAYCSQNTNSTTQAIVPFNSTRLNVGNHFDTSTYTFTAPVAGSYFFIATIYIQKNSTAYANLGLRKNGTTLLYTETDGTATQLSLTTSMVMTLAAGDTVYAFFGNNGSRQYYQGGTEDSFSGYLIG